MKPKNGPSSPSKLTSKITTAMLINCIMVIFWNYPTVSSLTVCRFSTAAIFSNIVHVIIFITTTIIEVPITIPYCKA